MDFEDLKEKAEVRLIKINDRLQYSSLRYKQEARGPNPRFCCGIIFVISFIGWLYYMVSSKKPVHHHTITDLTEKKEFSVDDVINNIPNSEKEIETKFMQYIAYYNK